jgi:hypothetical protein
MELGMGLSHSLGSYHGEEGGFAKLGGGALDDANEIHRGYLAMHMFVAGA